jgi:two-component system LytT family response regulator
MKVLIVDDEPVARRGLRRQVAQLAGVTCVGECGGRDEAVTAIRARQPDVVLLDIQLGRTSAFEIVEEIGLEAMPLVVFVTAYDRHAVKAFEIHALDYVLKPVDPERLREAIGARGGAVVAAGRRWPIGSRIAALPPASPRRRDHPQRPNGSSRAMRTLCRCRIRSRSMAPERR